MANYSTNGATYGMSYDNSQRSNDFNSLPNNINPIVARPHPHPQQQPQPGVNVNPFNVYTPAAPHPTVAPSQAQLSMVPAQQTNQWSLQPQQQNLQTPQQQPYNLQTPQPNHPQSQQHLQQSQQYHPQSQQPVLPKSGPFVPFTTHDSNRLPASTVPMQPVPSQPRMPQQQQDPSVDDFFGEFSSRPPTEISRGPRRPTEIIETNGGHDNLSVLSKATTVVNQRKYSPLEDPNFAPPPPRIQDLESIKLISQHAPPSASPLPDFHKVTHSGFVLSRISMKSILMKQWKQVFWISYGTTKLLIFRSSADFEDWVSNPYLTKNQRQFLIKMEVDFINDLQKVNVRGYQVTTIRSKTYQNKLLNQFKLERWMDYGPTIAAAFASPIEKDVTNLRVIIAEMMKRSPQELMLDIVQPDSNAHNSNYISSAASTGAVSDGGRSQRSGRSYGVLSTGPMERVRDPVRDVVGGYRTR